MIRDEDRRRFLISAVSLAAASGLAPLLEARQSLSAATAAESERQTPTADETGGIVTRAQSGQLRRWACLPDRIFDGERVRAGIAVLLRGEVITDLLPAAQIPVKLPLLRAPGCTLLPGLIDMHAHFSRWQGPVYLAYGVTTIRDVGNAPDWILARRAECRTRRWPTIYPFGPLVDGPKPVHPGERTHSCPDAASAKRAIAELAAKGVDGIKLYVGLRREWLAPTVEEAHQAGLHVAMHASDALAAGKAGVDEFFHLDGLLHHIWPKNPGGWLNVWGHPGFVETRDRQRRAADAIERSGMIATPTLAFWDAMGRRDVKDEEATERIREWRRALVAAQRFVGLLHRRGVPVLAGTDVPCGTKPGSSLWRELALLVGSGLSPVEALRAATSKAAACLKDESLGRLAAGRLADMVLVQGDPTREIPEKPEVALVVRLGQPLSPARLLTQARQELPGLRGDPWESEAAFPTNID